MTQVKRSKSLYKRNPVIVLREEDKDGGLLFNPDNNQAKVVNATGLFIWKQCDKGSNEQYLVNAITQEFEEAPKDEVETDVKEFLKIMTQSGFIEIIKDKQ